MRRIWISFPCMVIDLPEDFPLVRLAQVAHGAGWKLRFRNWRLEVVE
jgi:hypothetical protein